MRVKTVNCPIAEISVLMKELLQEFNSFSIFAKGSKMHKEVGLRDDYVLVRAWKYAARPDIAKRMKRNKLGRLKRGEGK